MRQGIVPTSIIVVVGLGLEFSHREPRASEPLRRSLGHSPALRRLRRQKPELDWGEVINIA